MRLVCAYNIYVCALNGCVYESHFHRVALRRRQDMGDASQHMYAPVSPRCGGIQYGKTRCVDDMHQIAVVARALIAYRRYASI